MADQESLVDVLLLKNNNISVFVEETLPDILVCTYEHGLKIFKGVLLDSTKRNLPCGIQALNPALNTKPDDDSLFAVNQRFAYTDPQNQLQKKRINISSKFKNNKMTVRLRPRQVLCSKCKGICNENSENVSRKRKYPEKLPSPPPTPVAKRSASGPVTRSSHNVEGTNRRKLISDKLSSDKNDDKISDIPREVHKEPHKYLKVSGAEIVPTFSINKLTLEENSNKTIFPMASLPSKRGSKINSITSAISKRLEKAHSLAHSETPLAASSETQLIESCPTGKQIEIQNKSLKRTLRKKRSVGSMEDLWDETCFEEKNNKNNNLINQNNANADINACPRTIKISYGPQGEGTVLKIPAQIENVTVSDDDSEENINVEENKLKTKDASNKAARKALKKAKKEAKRKVLLTGVSSPPHTGNISPRYSSGLSPRNTLTGSPRHVSGNNSPRYLGNSSELNTPRRRKHKMKHKKKHKDDKDRKHKEEVSTVSDETAKEQCVTQKLSINLKRLNNIYTSITDKNDDSSSDDNSDQVPDFPPPNPPLMLRLNAKPVSSIPGADGSRLLVGDVVWGKLVGFPWWPGKVLTITNPDDQSPQAHVAWYGTCTSSLIQYDQLCPYLENFKVRYDKKKKGAYKEAIRQASTEAKENAENRIRDQIASSSPARSIITVVPPALASPREIDVVS